MSRVGLKKLLIPSGVNVALTGSLLKVTGPKGVLSRTLHPDVTVQTEGNVMTVSRSSDHRAARALHGLMRNEVGNMLTGVTQGYEKILEISGVGFRAALEGRDLVMGLGFSHPTRFPLPEGIQVSIEKQTIVTIKGIDKYVVGQTAAKIRALKPPEPYKGKGIKYRDEKIIRKEGKAGKAGK